MQPFTIFIERNAKIDPPGGDRAAASENLISSWAQKVCSAREFLLRLEPFLLNHVGGYFRGVGLGARLADKNHQIATF